MSDDTTAAYCDICGGPHWSHFLQRLRYAVKATLRSEPGSPAARLRLIWHDFVIHAVLDRGGERCQECGHTYPQWSTTTDEWVSIMGSPSGLLCRPCFDRRLEDR